MERQTFSNSTIIFAVCSAWLAEPTFRKLSDLGNIEFLEKYIGHPIIIMLSGIDQPRYFSKRFGRLADLQRMNNWGDLHKICLAPANRLIFI